MAQRRMFSPDIVESDAFLEMPISSQALYFHLGMYADDDGFVNPKKIMRMIGVSDDDLKVLTGKRFVLIFANGVIVIKHWRVNNLVRKDWYRPTQYVDEIAQLAIKESGAYTEKQPVVNESLTVRPRRLGKDSIGKDIKKEEGKVAIAPTSTPKAQARAFFDGVLDLVEKRDTPLAQEVQGFLREVSQVNNVPKEVIWKVVRNFCQYWTERNPTGTKEKWEMQKTFEVKLRLGTWFRKEGHGTFAAPAQSKGREIISSTKQ